MTGVEAAAAVRRLSRNRAGDSLPLGYAVQRCPSAADQFGVAAIWKRARLSPLGARDPVVPGKLGPEAATRQFVCSRSTTVHWGGDGRRQRA